MADVFSLRDRYLFCEDVQVNDIQRELKLQDIFPSSPCFVYSKRKLLSNILDYQRGFRTLETRSLISYAMKANHTPALLDIIRSRGCLVTLVSGMEMKLALNVGFHPMNMIFNGNGKQNWERMMAIKAGCMINVDSHFDLIETLGLCREENTTANVLLRINPDIDPEVHPFISTGLGASKFGISEENMDACINEMIQNKAFLILVGLHCHLGSTINNTDVFRLCISKLMDVRDLLMEKGFNQIQYINIGGGLNIDDRKPISSSSLEKGFSNHTNIVDTQSFVTNKAESCEKDTRTFATEKAPTVADLVSSIHPALTDSDVTLIVEPGRSIVGNTAILSTTVIGTKTNNHKRFIITDGSMTEVIRPSLYGAYHHIDLTEPPEYTQQIQEISVAEDERFQKGVMDNRTQSLEFINTKLHDPAQSVTVGNSKQSTKTFPQRKDEFDIVGPVCESTDVLGKNRMLPKPHRGCGLAVFDVGAYCSSMSSNYNLRLRPCEVLVDGDNWRLIRKPDTFDDLMMPYRIEEANP